MDTTGEQRPPTPHAGAPTCTVSGLNGSRVNVRFKSTRTRLAATGSPAYVLRSAALAVLGRAFAGDAPRLDDDAPSLDGAGVASDVSSGSSGEGTKAGLLVYDWLARLPAGVRCAEASMAAGPWARHPALAPHLIGRACRGALRMPVNVETANRWGTQRTATATVTGQGVGSASWGTQFAWH